MQGKRKRENNLQAKTLSEIFKKIDVLSWARSLIVQSITRHHIRMVNNTKDLKFVFADISFSFLRSFSK